jgi:enoyl-CoA hydratase/carnithine racemase
VRVVILDAEGASFSAGLDRRMLTGAGLGGEPSLADLAALDAPALDRTLAGFQAAFTWWRQSPAVTIAAVAGHAVGAGFQLALACDLIVCADDAQFAMREVSLGFVPDLGGTARLVAAVGTGRALEICGTGRWVGAQEAVHLGLAVAAVPSGELDAAVDDLTAALLAAPRGALRETVQLIRGAADRSEDAQLAAERAAQARRLAELAGSAAS